MLYMARFRFRHTAADAADTAIFAMRNPVASGKVITIQKIIHTESFDGVVAVSHVGHGWSRFTGANPTGGTSPVRAEIRSEGDTSAVTDASIKEGAALTLAGVFEGNFHELDIPTVPGTALAHIIDFIEPETFRLLPGEGLALRTTLTAVVGTVASGSVWWQEN